MPAIFCFCFTWKINSNLRRQRHLITKLNSTRRTGKKVWIMKYDNRVTRERKSFLAAKHGKICMNKKSILLFIIKIYKTFISHFCIVWIHQLSMRWLLLLSVLCFMLRNDGINENLEFVWEQSKKVKNSIMFSTVCDGEFSHIFFTENPSIYLDVSLRSSSVCRYSMQLGSFARNCAMRESKVFFSA